MKLAAADFKARCLPLLDHVNQRGETITITERFIAIPPIASSSRPAASTAFQF